MGKSVSRQFEDGYLNSVYAAITLAQKSLDFALAKGWFHVEIKKGMKEDERQKRHEQEAFDGAGVVLQDMIGVPTLDQLVEAVVFDVPSLAPKTTARATGT